MSRKFCLFASLLIAVFFGFYFGVGAMAKNEEAVKVGDKAPDFSLPDQDGKPVSLKDFTGKKSVVLYFYPKDNTSICTKEACLFRDQYVVFREAGAEVIGVSSDSSDSHKKFIEAQHLPFKLLSDEGGQLRKTYGVPSAMGMLPGRVTYVIDPTGTVRLVFNSMMNAQKHVDEALKQLKEIDKPKANS